MTDFIAILALIAAVAVPVAIFWREHPKREITYMVEVLPLILTNFKEDLDRLKVTVDEVAVADPQLVTIHVWSSGRAAISFKAFQTPIEFTSSRPIVAELGQVEQRSGVPTLRIENGSLVFPIANVKKNMHVNGRFIIDGPPVFRSNDPLFDVDVLSLDQRIERWLQSRLAWSRRLFIMGGVSLAVALVTIIDPLLNIPDVMDWAVFSQFLTTFILGLVFVFFGWAIRQDGEEHSGPMREYKLLSAMSAVHVVNSKKSRRAKSK